VIKKLWSIIKAIIKEIITPLPVEMSNWAATSAGVSLTEAMDEARPRRDPLKSWSVIQERDLVALQNRKEPNE
jgi:hypothetical protein